MLVTIETLILLINRAIIEIIEIEGREEVIEIMIRTTTVSMIKIKRIITRERTASHLHNLEREMS